MLEDLGMLAARNGNVATILWTGKRTTRIRVRLRAALIGLSFVLAACEDEGNPGDDNLLTGASLVVVVLIVVGIIFMVRRRRG